MSYRHKNIVIIARPKTRQRAWLCSVTFRAVGSKGWTPAPDSQPPPRPLHGSPVPALGGMLRPRSLCAALPPDFPTHSHMIISEVLAQSHLQLEQNWQLSEAKLQMKLVVNEKIKEKECYEVEMIYLKADQDLAEQYGNANAPLWRIWILRFGLSAKPKHFETQAGRECSSGSWQPVCLPHCPAATSHGETLGHCACPRPTPSARPVAKVQTWHLGLALL